MYKLQDVPDYAALSELCYLLDGSNLTRLLTYEEFANMSKAMLMYQYINIDGHTLVEAQSRLENVTAKQKDEITELYLKILPIMRQYNVDRGQMQHG